MEGSVDRGVARPCPEISVECGVKSGVGSGFGCGVLAGERSLGGGSDALDPRPSGTVGTGSLFRFLRNIATVVLVEFFFQII